MPGAAELYCPGVAARSPSKLPPWPHYGRDEIDAVASVLRSGRVNYWTGDTVAEFEDAYAAYLGRAHAIALANGTLALEAALVALDIGPGDEVLVPARSFVASASCVLTRGATPRFVDLAADAQHVDVDSLEAARTPNTRAAVVVHLGGAMADMTAIMAWADQHGVRIIEDCAQAHGATWDGRPAGSWGHAAAFSFCQDKILSTGGEGGLLAIDDEAGFRKAWAAKDHGKAYAAVYEREHPPGFRWYVESAGSNWRMTGMQAAIGLRQLDKLPRWRELRERNAKILRAALSDCPDLTLEALPDRLVHAWYRAYVFIEAAEGAQLRDAIAAELTREGWWAQAGACPEIYREKLFVDAGLAPATRLPRAVELGQTSLSFLVHPTIDAETMHAYADAARAAVQRVRADSGRMP